VRKTSCIVSLSRSPLRLYMYVSIVGQLDTTARNVASNQVFHERLEVNEVFLGPRGPGGGEALTVVSLALPVVNSWIYYRNTNTASELLAVV